VVNTPTDHLATKTATHTAPKTATEASTVGTIRKVTVVENSKESTDLELKHLNSWLNEDLMERNLKEKNLWLP
jgi:hypothetical protein